MNSMLNGGSPVVRAAAAMLLGILALLPVRTDAQRLNDLQFEHIRVEQGLSQGLVKAIVQDRSGYMWFGTADGLNRYDGYGFTVFRADAKDSVSIGNGRIVALAVDSSNTLWIGTDDGLFSRDPRTGRFSRHSTRFDSRIPEYRDGISAIHIDNYGNVWIATHGTGLHRYSPAARTWRQYKHIPGEANSIGSNDVHTITPYGSRYLWLSSHGAGMDLFDISNGTSKTIRPVLKSGPDSLVTCAVMEGDSALWVGTRSGSIARLLLRGMRWKDYSDRYRKYPGREFVYPVNLLMDRHGRIWCGSEASGLIVLHSRGHVVHRFVQQTGRASSIGADGVRALYADRSGIVWIGTNGRGLSYTAPSIKPFSLIQEKGLGPYSLTFESVRSIYVDPENQIWVGGYGGLNIVDRDGRVRAVPEFSQDFRKRRERDELSSSIYAIHPHPTKPGVLLLGTEGDGLYSYETRSGRISRMPFILQGNGNAIRGSIVSKIRAMRDGTLWIGTELGVSILDPASGAIEHLPLSPLTKGTSALDMVREIYQDSRGWIWVGLDRSGVMLVDPRHRHGTVFSHDPMDSTTIPSNTVYCVAEDSHGTVWMGTGGGLSAYDRKRGVFTNFGIRDGLPNEVVYGILEDEDGYLWLSTNYGLARFHPKHGVTATYDAEDGLQGNEFNAAAYFRGRDGELFFGGVGGVTHFRPGTIQNNEYLPPLVITACKIGDNAIGYDPMDGDTIVIPASRNQTYITFAALNFVRSAENRYRYRILELHSDWQSMGTSRDLSLIGLSPGFYTLRIQGSNNDGKWNPDELTLYLQVTPAYYETVWFRIIGVLLLGFVAFGVYRWRIAAHRSQERKMALLIDERTARLTQTNEQLMKEIEHRRRAEEEAYRANAVKSEFLAHMSHEIRTPMNAILGFTELLQDKIRDDAQREYLDSIAISGNTLLQLINDILDLSRIEAGRLELVYKPTDIRGLIRDVSRIFEWNVKKRNLAFSSRIDEDLPRELMIDDVRLRQILLNLVGNAVKFTERGSILLRVTVLQRRSGVCTLEFSVTDTGGGIAPAVIEKIFEPFQQGPSARDRQTGGTGLGLAITNRLVRMMQGHIDVRSEVGKGSTFRVVFPDVVVVGDSAEPAALRTARDDEAAVTAGSGAAVAEDKRLGDDPSACRSMLEIITTMHLGTWEQIRGRFVLQEIERFGRTIQELGEVTHCSFFDDWTRTLLREVNSFDMDNLPHTLQSFEQEYRKLQELVARMQE